MCVRRECVLVKSALKMLFQHKYASMKWNAMLAESECKDRVFLLEARKKKKRIKKKRKKPSLSASRERGEQVCKKKGGKIEIAKFR